MRLSLHAVGLCCLIVVAGGCAGAGNGASVPASLPAQRPSVVEAGSLTTLGVRSGCATRAVFVRLDTEIRGYPLDARGVTPPCAKISGPDTSLVERGALAISVHGFLHSLSFQSDFGLTIDGPTANGDAPPSRLVAVSQDHVALALDSHVNDFVVASEGYEGDNCWFVVTDTQTRANRQNCDPNLSAIHALATDRRDELIVVGFDAVSNRSRIDIFAGPATSAPQLVRTIEGPATGLASPGPMEGYFDVSYSLATDPRSGTLYVYSSRYDWLDGRPIAGAQPASVVEFAADAAGNAAPLRVLSGPNVALVQSSFSVNVLGTDDCGNLFVFSPGARPLVNVFGPTAHGNAVADRSFTDPTAEVGFVGGSIAVRTLVR